MDMNELLDPSGEIVKYKQMEIGSVLQGVIVSVPKVFPDNKFGTNEQKESAAGNKLWKLKLTLETEDGFKTLFLDGGAYWETLNAIKAAKVRRFEDVEGGTYALKREADTPSKTEGFAPRKNFAVRFVLPI